MATMIVKKEAQAREPVPQKPEAITQSSVFGKTALGMKGRMAGILLAGIASTLIRTRCPVGRKR